MKVGLTIKEWQKLQDFATTTYMIRTGLAK